MHTSCSAVNGGVLSGFLATICNFWIVGENTKCFDEFTAEKVVKRPETSKFWKDLMKLGILLYDFL